MISQTMIVIDVIFFICGILLAIGFISVDMNKKKRKEWKCMKEKTTAREISSEVSKDSKLSGYVFTVNGKEYKGFGEVQNIRFTDKIRVRYDPADPGNNCTEYDYWWRTGLGEAAFCLALACGIVIIPIILTLIFDSPG